MSALLDADARLNALSPRPFPLPLGRLAGALEGAVAGFGKKGWLVLGPRERIAATLRGAPVERLLDAHAGARPYKLAPCSSAPGSRALHAVGLALATGEPTLCVLGLASAASGALHEALNLAALTRAPVIFVLAIHALPADAPVGPQLAASPADLAAAFGLATARAAATATAVADAVAAALASGAPTLIEAILE